MKRIEEQKKLNKFEEQNFLEMKNNKSVIYLY
jgi:hypothetical protein